MPLPDRLHVDAASVADLVEAEGALILDIREPYRRAMRPARADIQHSLGLLLADSAGLPHDRTLLLLTDDEEHAPLANRILTERGFRVLTIKGGALP